MATLVARISSALQAVAVELKNIRSKLPVYSTTVILDSNYNVIEKDRCVLVNSITSSRAIYLPEITEFPNSTILILGDSSGSVSEVTYIDIICKSSDTILGFGNTIRISSPFLVCKLIRGPERKWVVC